MKSGQSREVVEAIEWMKTTIVNGFAPEKVILFGSYARNNFDVDSDVDILVVMPVEGSKRKLAARIDLALAERQLPLDLIVVTPEEFERYRDVAGHIIYPAAHEGKVLYDRAA